MSEIKALEKLRNLDGCIDIPMLKIKLCANTNTHNVIDALGVIADEIEAEIAERFMELPCDADGVPICVGDYLQLGETRGEVVALTYCPANGKLPWEWQCDTGDWYNTAFSRHVKPRTLEEMLLDLANEVWEASCTCQTTWSDSGLDGIEERYADEIRAMFGEADDD